jgi:hypothetical protein
MCWNTRSDRSFLRWGESGSDIVAFVAYAPCFDVITHSLRKYVLLGGAVVGRVASWFPYSLVFQEKPSLPSQYSSNILAQ